MTMLTLPERYFDYAQYDNAYTRVLSAGAGGGY